jgi:hypothetical protein
MLLAQNTAMSTIAFDNGPNIIEPSSSSSSSLVTKMMMLNDIMNFNYNNNGVEQHGPRRVSVEAHSGAAANTTTNTVSGEQRRNSGDSSSNSADEMNNAYKKFAFPFKLHSILENTENNKSTNKKNVNWSSIISWLPSGKAFKIHKPKEFATEIMPEYFSQTKYRSFQRQLHIYGFDRIKDKCSEDCGAFYHELFIRGQSEMCLDMTRQKIKGTGLSNEVRKAKAAKKANNNTNNNNKKRPSSSSLNTANTIQKSTLLQSMMMTPSQPNATVTNTTTDNMKNFSNNINMRNLIFNDNNNTTNTTTGAKCTNIVPSVEVHMKTPGRRCSLGFIRGTRMGRRGSLVFDGDEVCFGDKKFFFTTQY